LAALVRDRSFRLNGSIIDFFDNVRFAVSTANSSRAQGLRTRHRPQPASVIARQKCTARLLLDGRQRGLRGSDRIEMTRVWVVQW